MPWCLHEFVSGTSPAAGARSASGSPPPGVPLEPLDTSTSNRQTWKAQLDQNQLIANERLAKVDQNQTFLNERLDRMEHQFKASLVDQFAAMQAFIEDAFARKASGAVSPGVASPVVPSGGLFSLSPDPMPAMPEIPEQVLGVGAKTRETRSAPPEDMMASFVRNMASLETKQAMDKNISTNLPVLIPASGATKTNKLTMAGIPVYHPGGAVDEQMPLFAAASRGDVSAVERLVKGGADPEVKDAAESATPLWIAADCGHVGVVECLVKCGADKESNAKYGRTPLWKAASKGHIKIVECLVKNGADMERRADVGHTPLLVAAVYGHLEVVKFLVKSGADMERKVDVGTPLHIAVNYGHFEVVEYLVRSGAERQSQNMKGLTPLDLARQQGKHDVVRFLEQNTRSLLQRKKTARKQDSGNSGAVPTHEAQEAAERAMMELLAEEDAERGAVAANKSKKKKKNAISCSEDEAGSRMDARGAGGEVGMERGAENAQEGGDMEEYMLEVARLGAFIQRGGSGLGEEQKGGVGVCLETGVGCGGAARGGDNVGVKTTESGDHEDGGKIEVCDKKRKGKRKGKKVARVGEEGALQVERGFQQGGDVKVEGGRGRGRKDCSPAEKVRSDAEERGAAESAKSDAEHETEVERLRKELNRIRMKNDEGMCVVCLEHRAVSAFLPCGHRCVCVGCAAMLVDSRQECPICRVGIASWVRIYDL